MQNTKLTKSIREIIKTIGIVGLLVFPCYLSANVTVGGTVTQSTIPSAYTSQCSYDYDFAIYEGQSFVSVYKHTPSTLLSSREYFPNINVKIYNPNSALGNQSGQNTLGGLLPTFIYKSNGRPGTSYFNFPGVQTVYVYKQNASTYAVSPSTNTNRNTVATQIVHDFFRKQIKSRGGSSFNMSFLADGSSTSQSFSADPYDWYGMNETVKCQNFYVAKCGDGILDNINQTGNINTNGKDGILIGGSIINRWSPGFDPELCDDGNLIDGDGCSSTCGRGGASFCGDKIINDDGTEEGHGPIYFSGGVEMIEMCDDGPWDDITSIGNNDSYQMATCATYCEKNTEPEQLPEELGQ